MTAHPVDALYAALERGDLAGARDCFASDAVIWHNFDCKEQSLDEAVAGWGQYISLFSDRHPTKVRRHEIPGGIIQQHMSVVRLPDGSLKAWAACIVVQIDGGRIVRLEEYVDGSALLPFPEETARAEAE